MPPREIPGFYYDEETGRYYAIPNSRNSTSSESEAIKNIDNIVSQSYKRQKLDTLTKTQEFLMDFKHKQDQFFAELDRVKEEAKLKGFIPNKYKPLLRKHSRDILDVGSFQMTELECKFILDTEKPISGFSLNVILSNVSLYNDDKQQNDVYDTLTAYTFYTSTPEGEKQTYYLEDQLEITTSNKYSRCYGEFDVSSRLAFLAPDHVHLNDVNRITSAECVFEFGDTIPSLMRGSFGLLLTNSKYKIKRFHRNGGIHELYSTEDEILCFSIFDKYKLAAGTRSGTLSFTFNRDETFKIELEVPICSVETIYSDEDKIWYAIVSTTESLLSYSINIHGKKAELHMIYDDYKWSGRVALNMKSISDKKIFAVESATDSSSEKLEIKFYNLTCPKSLMMYSGPFYISNSPYSYSEWTLLINRLFLLKKEDKSFNIYVNMNGS